MYLFYISFHSAQSPNCVVESVDPVPSVNSVHNVNSVNNLNSVNNENSVISLNTSTPASELSAASTGHLAESVASVVTGK